MVLTISTFESHLRNNGTLHCAPVSHHVEDSYTLIRLAPKQIHGEQTNLDPQV